MAREILIANLTFLAAMPFVFLGHADMVLVISIDITLGVLLFIALFRAGHSQLPAVVVGVVAAASLAILVTSGVFISLAAERFVASAPKYLDEETWATFEFFTGLWVAFFIGLSANEHFAAAKDKKQIQADVTSAYLRIWTAGENCRTGVISPAQLTYEGRLAVQLFASKEGLHREAMPNERVREMQRQVRDYTQLTLRNPIRGEQEHETRLNETLQIAARFYWLGGRRFRFTNTFRFLAQKFFDKR